MPPKGRKTRQNSGDFGASAKLPEAGALPTTKYVVSSINLEIKIQQRNSKVKKRRRQLKM